MTQYQQRSNENVAGAAIRIADALNCWLSKGQKPPHLLRRGARIFRAELMNWRRLIGVLEGKDPILPRSTVTLIVR